MLFEKLQLPVLKKTKTGPSTDADVLEQLAAMGHEVPRLILEYRELQKLQSTYVDVLPARVNRDHRADPHQLQPDRRRHRPAQLLRPEPAEHPGPHAAGRGDPARASCRRPGWLFVVADYSQIELRLMAHLSGDPAFIEAFRQGDDIHRQTAALIFGVPLAQVTSEMRARAKTINFATIYGQGPFALSRQLGITQEEAKAFIAAVLRAVRRGARLPRPAGGAGARAGLRRDALRPAPLHPGDQRQELQHARLRRAHGPEHPAAGLGRRPDQDRDDPDPRRAPRDGPPQRRMLLQVHDELVFEAPEAEVGAGAAAGQGAHGGRGDAEVPLVVDVGVGTNWLDAKR